MNRLEHLLVIAAEECTEIAHAICKALRFGLHDTHLNTVTQHRIENEFSQLIAVLEMLDEAGVSVMLDEDVKKAKKLKVEEHLVYSKKYGTLDD